MRVGEHLGQHVAEPRRPLLDAVVGVDQVLAHLDQHMGKPARLGMLDKIENPWRSRPE